MTPEQRVWRLVEAARRIAEPQDPLGRRAREQWHEQLGLSLEAIELGLECLETQPTQQEVAALCFNVAPAPQVWVVLSANVFVAAHRAIALGLAASARVMVKPSRRDPTLAKLLHEAAPGLFALVEEIAPAAGDHVYAYGREETLASLRACLPTGVIWHAHGPGLGLALVVDEAQWRAAAAGIAFDVTAFEQRGCLSPRLVGLSPNIALDAFCEHLAENLRGWAARVPAPTLATDERAQRTWFEQVGAYCGALYPAGPGVVFAYDARRLASSGGPRAPFIPLAPPSRSLTVFASPAPCRVVSSLEPWVTTIAGEAKAEAAARAWFPRARYCRYGQMQRPRFDGPVDWRPGSSGEVI